MIKSVSDYPISQIFDIEANLIFKVPRYQREYTWSRNQWESLYDDIQSGADGYFIVLLAAIV